MSKEHDQDHGHSHEAGSEGPGGRKGMTKPPALITRY